MALQISSVNPITLNNGSLAVDTTEISLTNLTSANHSTLVLESNVTWSTNNTDFLLTTQIPPADYVTGIMYFYHMTSRLGVK